MKPFPVILLVALFLAGLNFASAQTASSQTTNRVTLQEKARLVGAQEKVLSTNSALKAEQDQLEKDRLKLKKNSTPPSTAVRLAMIERKKAFDQKLQTAMLKTDPTLKPIFDKMAPASNGTMTGTTSSPQRNQ